MTASAYGRLTPRMAWQLAAPHTWPAAILPVLVAAAAAAVTSFSISATMVCVLLVICVLMQSAVNTFNDYYDYVKGADSADDNVDPTDAVLVYNNVNPRAALALAVGFLAAAFLLGAYVIWIAGWIPLAIGAAGAVVVVLYSAGKTPISYLPIGELVSGFVMGGLIPLACYQALSGTFDLRALLWAVPTILGVGLIMFTNNTCDVEKDVESGTPHAVGAAGTRAGAQAVSRRRVRLGGRHRRARGRVLHERASGDAVHAAGKLSPAQGAAGQPVGAAGPHRRHGAGV